MVILFSFTTHSLLFVQKDLEEILFTTGGAEHTEKMIKNMFNLLCLLCVARSALVYSVVRMFCRRGFMPRKFDLSSRATGCEKRVKIDWCSSGFIPRLLVILFTTEGAEHTEKMIKNMFNLLCLLCVARSASVYSVVRMFCRRGFMPRRWF